MFYTRGHCGFGTRVTHGPGFRLLRPREGPRGAGLQTSPRRDQMRVSPPKHEVPTQQAGGGARQPQASGSGKEVHRDRKPRQKGHPPSSGKQIQGPGEATGAQVTLSSLLTEGLANQTATSPSRGRG